MRRAVPSGAAIVVLGLSLLPRQAHAQLEPFTVTADGVPTRVVAAGLEDRAAGAPVLVLLSGGGSPLEYWGDWLRAVSEVAPVVAYDRPGIGGSEYDGRGLSPERVSQHLDSLLAALDAPPPYVLVGHSWGGPLMLHYSRGRTDDIVGMVYLDPTDPRVTRLDQWGATDEAQFEAFMEMFSTMLSSRNVPAGLLAENEAMMTYVSVAASDRGVPEDPPVPTAVVLGRLEVAPGPDLPSFVDDEYVSAWMNRRLAQMAAWVASMPRGTLYFSSESGHNVHRQVPGLALQAVQRVLDAVAGGSQPRD